MTGTFTADKIIGKGIYAKQKVDKLNSSLQKIGEFKAGEPIGIVWSYIERNGKVYWMFVKGSNEDLDFLVEHGSSLTLTDDINKLIKDKESLKVQENKKTEVINKIAKKNILLFGIAGILAFFIFRHYRKK
jgi:hypothetical protein